LQQALRTPGKSGCPPPSASNAGLHPIWALALRTVWLQNFAVERTLKEHLDSLRGRLETLSSQLMECANREDANRLQSEIRAIELAIAHYEAALKIEKRFAPTASWKKSELTQSA
jgi:hypothetical protein